MNGMPTGKRQNLSPPRCQIGRYGFFHGWWLLLQLPDSLAFAVPVAGPGSRNECRRGLSAFIRLFLIATRTRSLPGCARNSHRLAFCNPKMPACRNIMPRSGTPGRWPRIFRGESVATRESSPGRAHGAIQALKEA